MIILFTLLLFFVPLIFHLVKKKKSSRKLPPGSLGLPFIGQSITLLRAMKGNTGKNWLEGRVAKYGPISKMSLFGKPAVFIYGQAANKFVFTSDDSTLSNQQTQSIKRILGDRTLLQLSGEDHKRVRGALVSFLKPESLKLYVSKVEEEIRRHLQMHWQGKDIVKVLPLMKTLTFNIICSILFGVPPGPQRDRFVDYFQMILEGMWSIPINLPFTRYRRSLNASDKVKKMVKELIREKKDQLQKGASSNQDLITSMISIAGEGLISEDEIVDNIMLIMVAGHDTSSVLITFIMRVLSNDPVVYEAVLKEQEETAKNKLSEEFLTWEDLLKMKYTWRVAMETLRYIPPVFGGFRTTLKDIEYGGYLIPKGWQVFWAAQMTHMDNEIFEEASKFDPARFEKQSSIPPYCYIPFGAGPRICPGYEFARIETLLTLHYLVTHFNWKLSCPDHSFGWDPMPIPAQGLPIQIVPNKLLSCHSV